jgi:hypothetical protein
MPRLSHGVGRTILGEAVTRSRNGRRGTPIPDEVWLDDETKRPIPDEVRLEGWT